MLPGKFRPDTADVTATPFAQSAPLIMLSLVLNLALANVWAPTGNAVGKDATVSFTISVQQQHLAALKVDALAVSTPGSSKYGQFLTTEAINKLTAPLAADMEAVTSWLTANGVSHRIQNELVVASTTVSNAEALFNTAFFEVAHPDHGKKIVSGEYTVPATVQPSIASIFGLRGLPLPKRTDVVSGPHGPMEKVTPAVLASTWPACATVRGCRCRRARACEAAPAWGRRCVRWGAWRRRSLRTSWRGCCGSTATCVP